MVKKYDVITIGSAFQDVYVFSKKFRVVPDKRAGTGRSECFTFGTKIELDDILFEIGGGATNAAYTLKRQGLRVGCITRIGKDAAGKEVRAFFKQSRIADLSIIDPKKRTAHSVVFLGKGGERTILVYRGASHDFKTRDVSLSKLKNSKWIYCSSLAGNIALMQKIVAFAKKNSVQIAINPGKREIRKNKQRLLSILKEASIVSMNREEAALLTNRPYQNIKGILQELDVCCKGVVLITEGSSGSYIALNGKKYRGIIKPVQAVDTTGAGDAFTSGFIAGYIRSKGDIKKALILASNNAASVIMAIGAKHGLLAGPRYKKTVQLTIKDFTK